MNLFWAVFLPSFLAGFCFFALLWAARLQFFNKTVRSLEKIDIPNEVKEVRIYQLEEIISEKADLQFRHGWGLSRWQRRQATTARFRDARKWLYLVISNAALFQEVARFQMQVKVATADDLMELDGELPFRVLDRAAMVQFMATACLVKLMVLDVCRFAWPVYVPNLAGRFAVRGDDLIVWYRSMAREMLELAEEYYDDITYTRFIFQLTGVFNVKAAEGLKLL